MKKIKYTWSQIEGACIDLARQLNFDNWKPDYIVGISRGGLVPANLLSQYLNIKMHVLHVSLRDHPSMNESNTWMSSDALGSDNEPPANILIIDDINDSGATISWIKDDWQQSCCPKDPKWNNVWGNNVRIATIFNNVSSYEKVDYFVEEINKLEKDVWVVFPWEEFWWG